MTQFSDHQMIDLLNEGGERAYTYFYKLFIPDMYSYGISFGADEATIKDFAQDIFINIYSSKVKFQSSQHLKFYLLRAIKNRLYDFYRSQAVTSTDSIDAEFFNENGEFSIKSEIMEELLDSERQQIIQQKIDKMLSILTDRQREVIYLRYTQELEYEEIAELLNLTVHGSRKLVSRALKKLREEYSNYHLILLYALFFKI